MGHRWCSMKQKKQNKNAEKINENKSKPQYKKFFIALILIIGFIAVLKLIEKPIPEEKITGQTIQEIPEQKPIIAEKPSIIPENEGNKGITKKDEPNVKKVPLFSNYYEFGEFQTNIVHSSDVNKDGFSDVIIGSADAKTYLYLNNKKNGFSKSFDFDLVRTSAITTGDFNSDGLIDVALGVSEDKNYVFYNNGKNSFLKSELPTTVPNKNTIMDLDAADFDNDGRTDIAVARDNDGSVLYINEGIGNFVSSPQFNVSRAQRVLFADFDSDGWLDVLLANYNQDSYIYFNRATREAKLFDQVALTGKVGNYIRAVSICDINKDGLLDIVSANYAQENSIYLNKGKRKFEKQGAFDRGNAVAIICNDFNNDTWPDVVVANYNEESYIYLNNMTNFKKINLQIPGNINSIDSADINKDNIPDIIVGKYTGKTEAWLNQVTIEKK
jgi:hypothetical protein